MKSNKLNVFYIIFYTIININIYFISVNFFYPSFSYNNHDSHVSC